MLSTDFLIGLLIGVAAVYVWHRWQNAQAGQ